MRTKVENKLYMREYRAKKAASRGLPAHVPPASFPDDPAGAVAEWSERVLTVPPGHPLAGSPMKLPGYGVDFLRDVFSHRESLLCIARKNSKSGIVAIYLLARLVGPVRVAGYRAGVVSVSALKAGELKRQCEEIAVASGLRGGLRFLRSPAPGRIEGPMGTVDILSADKSSGHASGFDDAIVDELGLLKERDRGLVNGMRAATSARDGRFVALTIYGDGPFVPEIIERREDPAVAVHFYRAREGAALDDPEGVGSRESWSSSWYQSSRVHAGRSTARAQYHGRTGPIQLQGDGAQPTGHTGGGVDRDVARLAELRP